MSKQEFIMADTFRSFFRIILIGLLAFSLGPWQPASASAADGPIPSQQEALVSPDEGAGDSGNGEGGETNLEDTQGTLSDEGAQEPPADDLISSLLGVPASPLEAPVTLLAAAYQVSSASELQDAVIDALSPGSLGDTIEIMQDFAITTPIVVDAQAPTLAQLTIMSDAGATLTAAGSRHFSVLADTTFTLAFSNIVFDGAGTGGGIVASGPVGSLTIDGSSTSAFNNCTALRGGAFEIGSTETTVRGFSVNGCAATVQGGGIWVVGDGPVFSLLNSSVSGCQAPEGGGLWIGERTNFISNRLDNVSFTNNRATGNGGAVFAGGMLDVTASSFVGNNAGGSGGALYIEANAPGGSVYLATNALYSSPLPCVFENNTAQGDGGAICGVASGESSQVDMHLLLAHIANNSAQGNGGGISSKTPLGYSQILLHAINVTGNQAVEGNGGGVFVESGFGSTTNVYPVQDTDIRSYISDNRAGGSGGGIYAKDNGSASATLQQASLDRNVAGGDGGALYMSAPSTSMSLDGWSEEGTARDVLFSENVAGGSGGAVSLRGEASLEHEWGGVNAMFSYSRFLNNSAQENGGALSFYAENSASAHLNSTVFMGNSAQGNGGALSVLSDDYTTMYMTGGSCPEDLTTIVSGNHAGMDGGGVWMKSANFATMYLQGTSKMDNNRASGSGGGAWISCPDVGISVMGALCEEGQPLSSLSSNVAQSGSGGGIYVEGHANSLAVYAMKIEGNRALGGDGGAICYVPTTSSDYGSYISFGGSVISDNSASQNGGALFAGDTIASSTEEAYFSVHYTIFSRNTASTGSGGAVYLGQRLSYFEIAYDPDHRCVYEGNVAGLDGGALFVASLTQPAYIDSARFVDNTALRDGGAIWVPYESLQHLFIDSRILDESEKTVFTGNTARRQLETILMRFPDDIAMHDANVLTNFFSERPSYSPLAPGMFAYGYNNFDISYRTAFIVQYEGNGATAGSVPQDMNAYLEGDGAQVLGQGDMTRDGYAFMGWSLTPDGAQLVDASLVFAASDIVLYAAWQPVHVIDGGTTPSTGDSMVLFAVLIGVIVASAALCFGIRARLRRKV